MEISEEEFIKNHSSQFTAVGLPQNLWPVVYQKSKLTQEEIEDDITKSFDLLRNYNLKYPKDIRGNSYSLISKTNIPNESDVLLFSHIIKLNDLNEANLKTLLLENAELQNILWNFFNCEDYVINQSLNNPAKLNMYFTLQNLFNNEIPPSALLYNLSKNRWELVNAMNGVEEYQKSDTKLPIFDHCFTKKYIWKQDQETLTVYVTVPNDANKKTIKSTLKKTEWALSVNNVEIFSGNLFSKVDLDDSYWTICRDEANQTSTLIMTLAKEDSKDLWSSIFAEEERCDREDCEVLFLPRDKITVSANDWEKDEENVRNLIENIRLLHYSEEKRVELIIRLLQSYYGQSYAESRPSLSSRSGYETSNVWYLLDQQGSALTLVNKGEEELKVNSKCVVFINVFTAQAMSILWPISDISKGDELVTYRTSLTWSSHQNK